MGLGIQKECYQMSTTLMTSGVNVHMHFTVNTHIILISDVNAGDFYLEIFDNLCRQFLRERVFLLFLSLL